MDGLKLIIDKISQYNFLTNILPGTVLCILLKYVVGYNLFVFDDWYLMGIVFYFIGIVNNRFGSLCVEYILKKLHIVTFAPYKNFVKAEQKDAKITILSTENNVFRSYISVCLLTLVSFLFKLITNYCFFIDNNKTIIIIILILILFVFSYRKQTNYVKTRIETTI